MTTLDLDSFDEQLRTFLEARARDAVGVRGAPEMVAVLERRLASPLPARIDRRRGALVLASLGLLIVALIASSLGGGATREDRPVDADHQRSETSLGTIEWTRVETDARIAPIGMLAGRYLGFDDEGDIDDPCAWCLSSTDFGAAGRRLRVRETRGVSANGTDWETFTLPSLPGEPSLGVVGDLLSFGPEVIDGRYVSWVGKMVD